VAGFYEHGCESPCGVEEVLASEEGLWSMELITVWWSASQCNF
jgi:hypothetical protein